MSKTTYHRDGQVTYGSVYGQRWIKTHKIPDDDLATMSPKEVERITKHVAKFNDDDRFE